MLPRGGDFKRGPEQDVVEGGADEEVEGAGFAAKAMVGVSQKASLTMGG